MNAILKVKALEFVWDYLVSFLVGCFYFVISRKCLPVTSVYSVEKQLTKHCGFVCNIKFFTLTLTLYKSVYFCVILPGCKSAYSGKE